MPLARSEVIENNNNPAFVTPFLVPKTRVHDFDPVPIRFAVYDSDDARDELIGAVEHAGVRHEHDLAIGRTHDRQVVAVGLHVLHPLVGAEG